MSDAVLEVEARLKNFISGEVKNIVKELKNLDNTARTAGGGVSAIQKSMDGFARSVKTAAVAYVATRVFSAINKDLQESIELYKKQALATARVNAAIKSTGGVAGITQERVATLADNLQRVTTVGDEVTESGAAMLLTFTNIGSNVFPQATETMLNMAAAFGQGEVTAGGVQQAAVQLGKALNDPITGATALRRVGVNLTEQQQDQIKTLVSQNKLYEAQKIVLDELQVEFGGMARALAETDVGQIQQLNNEINDMKEKIGKELLPYQKEWNKLILETLQGWEWIYNTVRNLLGLQTESSQVEIIAQEVTELKVLRAEYESIRDTQLAMKAQGGSLFSLDELQQAENNIASINEQIIALAKGSGNEGGGGKQKVPGLPSIDEVEETKGSIQGALEAIRQMEIDIFGKPLDEESAIDYELQKLDVLQAKWDEQVKNRKDIQDELDRVVQLAADLDIKEANRAYQEKMAAERTLQNYKAKAVQDSIGLIGMLSQASGAQGKHAKAFAIGQAFANTAVSVTKTAATLGFPTAIPFIALAIAQGAAQLAIINRQKFAGGGVVQGALTGDRNVIGANAGEMVLTPTMQRELLASLSSGRVASNTYNNNNSRSLGGVTFNVSAGSSDIVSEIKQAVRDRRLNLTDLMR